MYNIRKIYAAAGLTLALLGCTGPQAQQNIALSNGGQTLALFKPQGNGTSRVEVMLILGANRLWTCDGTASGENFRSIEPQQVALTCHGITRSGVADLSNDPRTGGMLIDYRLEGDLSGRMLIN